jgi:AsmA protein
MIELAPFISPHSAPRRKYWSRAGWLFAGLITLFTIFNVGTPFFLSADDLRREIAENLKATTGIVPNLRGAAVIALFPLPQIRIDTVEFDDPSGALSIRARRYIGYVRVLPLLAGRLEVAASTLEEPKIAIDLARQPVLFDSAIGRAALARSLTPQARQSDQTRLGSLTLVNGSAHLKYSQSKAEDLDYGEVFLDKINLDLDWRRFGAPLSLIGTAVFAHDRVDLAIWMAHPSEFLRGAKSRINLRLKANMASFSAHGELAGLPGWQFNGTINTLIPNLHRFIRKAGLPLPIPNNWTRFSLESETNLSPQTSVLSNLHFKINDNEFDGALAYQADIAKPMLTGTLATDLLNFTASSGDWPSLDQTLVHTLAFAPKLRDCCNLDLRISAARLQFQQFTIEDAAVSVMRKDNRLELALAEALAYQGTIRGHATFELDPHDHKTLALTANGSAREVNLAAFTQHSEHSLAWGGEASATVNVKSNGQSIDLLLHHLNGQAECTILQGKWPSILDKPLENSAAATQSSDLSLDPQNFQSANLSLKISDGLAKIESASIESEDLHMVVSGDADIAETSFNLHILAAPAKKTSPAEPVSIVPTVQTEPSPIGFAITGPFHALRLSRD